MFLPPCTLLLLPSLQDSGHSASVKSTNAEKEINFVNDVQHKCNNLTHYNCSQTINITNWLNFKRKRYDKCYYYHTGGRIAR